jgi:hypothetical protein
VGDEPYAAVLPWMVYAVVDRANAGGPIWAGLGALITAIALLLTSRRGDGRSHNVIMLGAVGWFGALTVAGALHPSETGFLTHDGRALSAAGFALIAFGSLALTPAAAHFTRPHVRSSHRDDPAFRRVNVLLTSIWAATFTAIAIGHAVAASLGTPEANTLLNWVVPIVLAAFAAHRSRLCWDEFSDDDDQFEPDPMRDLELDWHPPMDSRNR